MGFQKAGCRERVMSLRGVEPLTDEGLCFHRFWCWWLPDTLLHPLFSRPKWSPLSSSGLLLKTLNFIKQGLTHVASGKGLIPWVCLAIKTTGLSGEPREPWLHRGQKRGQEPEPQGPGTIVAYFFSPLSWPQRLFHFMSLWRLSPLPSSTSPPPLFPLLPSSLPSLLPFSLLILLPSSL